MKGRELEAASLAVMHAGYRLPATAMRALLDAARSGAVFDEATLRTHESERSTVVAITRFEDGRLMLRDGLHRATAVMLARPRGRLRESEYVIDDMTYDMYLSPVLEAGLIAPFDPRLEVRIADWGAYRDEVLRRIREDDDPLGYIDTHRQDYVVRREPHHDRLSTFCEAVWPYCEDVL